MAAEYLAPPYKDFLTCLLPESDASKPLYSRIEDTLFGAHVPSDDSSTSERSGFVSSSSEASGFASNPNAPSSPAPFSPSHFTWRNTVSSSQIQLISRWVSAIIVALFFRFCP